MVGHCEHLELRDSSTCGGRGRGRGGICVHAANLGAYQLRVPPELCVGARKQRHLRHILGSLAVWQKGVHQLRVPPTQRGNARQQRHLHWSANRESPVQHVMLPLYTCNFIISHTISELWAHLRKALLLDPGHQLCGELALAAWDDWRPLLQHHQLL